MKDEDKIASCLQLAMLLEASAYPKPGNVHRTKDFPETRFEHFLASAVVLGPTYRWAAHRGVMISRGTIDSRNAGLGKAIKMGVRSMMSWQRGGNTSLGTILLLTPLATATGLTMTGHKLDTRCMRANLKRILRSATHVDSFDVYRAISAASPGGVGSISKLDVMSPESLTRIERQRIRLLKIFEMSAKRDSVASEWVSGYRITFEIGYPYFAGCIEASLDLNDAIVNTFLRILSKVPDTLIARKVGMEKARSVSLRARKCLLAGGVTTDKGLRLVNRLDRDLRTLNHELNPGTTADILSAVLAIALLKGLRP